MHKLSKQFVLEFLLLLAVLPAVSCAAASIPADHTGDQRVNLADLPYIQTPNGSVNTESFRRFTFHWLMDVSVSSDAAIQQIYTDRSRYQPGQSSTITVKCANAAGSTFTGELGLYITRNGRHVDTLNQPVTIGGYRSVTKTFTWTVPDDDFQGYLVEAWLNNGSVAVSAIDVSSDWKRYPRYGYITEFYSSTPTSRNTEMLDQLSRDYHINSLQYYDWMWRHENVIQRDSSGNIDSPWTDWRNASISFNILQDSIAKANDRSIAPMPYFQIYMALDNYQQISGVSEQWGIYSDTNHNNQYSHDAGVNMWLFNPANMNWQDHLCGEYTDALTSMNWSGLHIDQLGDIGGGNYYDYWGNSVNMEWALKSMLDRSKDHLDYLETTNPSVQGRDALIFNIVDGSVGGWAVDEALASKTDIIYSELWDNDTYGGVTDFIEYAKARTSGKPVILAAYINRYENTGGYFDTDSVLLADAAFFASGAYHLELGDGEHMLAQEFFPARDKLIPNDLRPRLKDYYNFITAYQQLLFAPDLVSGDAGLQWISTPGYNLSGDAAGNTIWFLNRRTADAEIYHLINLLGNDNQWRNVANTPPLRNNVTAKLRLGPNVYISGIYLASPDIDHGIMQPLSYIESADPQGDYVSLTLPSLEYWDMIYVDRTIVAPAYNRYQAELANKWNVGVNTNHAGYTGSGFVDQYAETHDSVNFYITIPQDGSYNLNFRYGNGGSNASRSVIIDGDIQGDVQFTHTGSWGTWSTSSKQVHLSAGVHQVTLYYGPWNSGAINLDYLQIQ
ncbi:Cycloisomaltooligosaccharide glucanotransferase precursor [Anaerohalosphaera lusitana]|uniref:Cycloisomaltooligosaccharide glucanotransferase n=1 Tax=Anaerohalosphaera lusitana TaxID=1936003 RepID=A0A1U9NMN5_9BACT|nr:glycoside hydrolase family 66 protein [Anaerohalosphaera lusitana]AQT69212.1 Cycloisomaltooligosaccharide glucanotransferase precursor [Anaerohalosphaera lusitana]